MNKTRLIPVLALAALLTSCSLFGAKAPKFADEGEQVDYTDFINRISEAYVNSELTDTNVKLKDRIIKTSDYQAGNTVLKRNNKEISKSETKTNQKSEKQYDVDNFVTKMTGEYKIDAKGNGPEGSSSYSVNQKTENYYQFEKENSYTYFIEANAKSEECSIVDQVSSYRSKEDIFDEALRSVILNFANSFSSYVPSSSNDTENYLFYIKDDTLFTVSLTQDETNDYGNYECTIKRKLKAQLDLTDKKQALRISDETKSEYKYYADYNTFRDGDVLTENQVLYADYSAESKDYNLSPIDVSNYLKRY